MYYLIEYLTKIGHKKLAAKVVSLTAGDYAQQIQSILNSKSSKQEKEKLLEALVDSYKAQTSIHCPLMQLILKEGKPTLENVQKACKKWRGGEAC